MTRDEAFAFLDSVARGLAGMFGSSCQTLVQDYSAPDHPVLAAYHSREAEDEQFADPGALPGEQVKCAAFHLTQPEFDLVLGVRFDCAALVSASRVLAELIRPEADGQSETENAALALVFDESLAAAGLSVSELTRRDRINLVARMKRRHAFSYRGAVPYVAGRLGVSRYTVYKYLEEVEKRENGPAEQGR